MKSFYMLARERMVSYGNEELGVSELLAVIMGSHSVADTCTKLSNLPVTQLLNMTKEQFMEYDGIDQIIGHRLEATMSMVRKMTKLDLPDRFTIRSPADASRCFDFLKYKEQECFTVAFLNTKNQVLATEIIFQGSLNASIVHPREVFKKAIVNSSASIVVAHNHPSGDASPSREDIEVTKRLREVGKIVGVELLDHVIIGHNQYISLKEKGYL